MKTLKHLLPETITLAISFAGIVYAVFAASFIVGAISVAAFVTIIVLSLRGE